HVEGLPDPPTYLLLTDADIAYAPDTLTSLVARAQTRGLVLISLMAKLRCETFAERALIPAFVFFFQMLYPFAWVNRPDAATAPAAGGCMLVRRDALATIGGIEKIRAALIDDCALAWELKRIGPIWLSLTRRARSLRAYPRVADVRKMVARSAYHQLGYSPLLLAATAAGLALTFLAPPLLALFASGLARALGLAVCALMALAFQPMLRCYRVSPLWGLALPAIAAFYLAFTLDSAYQHWRGRGGWWDGRGGRRGEGRADGHSVGDAMRTAADVKSGKGHRDENFPVASGVIAPRHRGIILAFYRFVRTADDVADNATLAEAEKLALLDQLE